jgi:serine/threonine-protein kinase
MGRVYLAKQVDLGRQVVVKVMHDHIATDPKFRERFQRETLVMARFQHPYVVTLYDASLNDPQGPCIVMEYIRGVTLDTLLHRNGRLNPARISRLLGQLCEALHAAHKESIVHRDLKPGNLMVVDPDTPYEKIKVMDFGLAKLVETNRMSMHKVSDTGCDFAVGTPGYIAPEQVRGDELHPRSDLYSVGVILYELLAGRLPFCGEETMDVLLSHVTEAPPPFSAVGATWVSPAIEQVVMQCLEKDPNQRPSSARALADMFEAALADQSPAAVAAPADEAVNVDEVQPRRDKPPFDPNAIVHEMEAWMPETIAAYKLRGFVFDAGGEILESVPGRIRVRLGNKGGPYQTPERGFSLFSNNKKNIVDLELQLVRQNPMQENLLHITVKMSSPYAKVASTAAWREQCGKIYCDLRAYLAGASVHD